MSGHIWSQPSSALEDLAGLIEPVLGEVIVSRTIASGELTFVVEGHAIVRALTSANRRDVTTRAETIRPKTLNALKRSWDETDGSRFLMNRLQAVRTSKDCVQN